MTQDWVVFLGLRIPDLTKMLQAELVRLDLVILEDFIKLLCPPALPLFLFISLFLAFL